MKLSDQVTGCVTRTPTMHPFASYVLGTYYKATGWNEDNLYANLTRSSNGRVTIFYTVSIFDHMIFSHPGFHRPAGTSFLNIQVSESSVQDNVFNGSDAVS